MSEVYKSTTHGPIPLSFEGRRLLQNLRFAIKDAIATRDWCHNDNAVSKARGDIARHMSNMEKRTKYPGHPGVRTEQPEQKVIAGNVTYVLPPVPPGYVLRIVGSLAVMEPVKKTS